MTPSAGPPPRRLLAAVHPARLHLPPLPEGVPTQPGVLALAETLVSCDSPGLADLPAQLLGRTLIVRDLESARALAGRTHEYRLVTLQGEVIEPDGTLTIGTHHAETGILSRKSELRELRDQVVQIDRHMAETDRDLAELRNDMAVLDAEAERLQQDIDALADQAGDLRSRIGQHRQRREGLHEEVVLNRSEIDGIESEIQGLQTSWEQARDAAVRAEGEVQALQARIEAGDRALREGEARREILQQQGTAAKVALAQVEERLTALRARHQQTVTDLEQRRQEQQQAEQYLAGARSRLEESQCTMLQASMALAQWYLEKEAAERRLSGLNEERALQRGQRQQVLEQSQAVRSARQAQQEQVHTHELQVNDLRHRLDTLVERAREDYQVDLTALYERVSQPGSPAAAPPSTEARLETFLAEVPTLDPNKANEEVADLRKKLSRLGSVNMEALQELTELEARGGAANPVRRPGGGQAGAGGHHQQDQRGQPAAVHRDLHDDSVELPGAVSEVVRRRHGGHRSGG